MVRSGGGEVVRHYNAVDGATIINIYIGDFF